MKYDDAEYCFLNFETGLDNDAGATHIGFYLAWLILKNHGTDESAEDEAALRARTTTGPQVLISTWDCKLVDEAFDGDGNLFTAVYYNELYAKDYEQVFAADFPQTGHETDDFCSIPDTWENYERIARVLDARWRQWEAGQPFAPLAPSKPTLSGLSLEPTDTPAPPPAWLAPAAPAPAAAVADPAATQTAAQQLLYAAPPLPDALIEKIRQALSRFIGFEGFAPAITEAAEPTAEIHAERLVAEFPGGWHWLDVRAVDERAHGARPGWGVSLALQSRPQRAVSVDVPGFERVADPGQNHPDTSHLAFDAWWDAEAVALSRTRDGIAYLAPGHPSELDAALETLRVQVDKRLKPQLRKYEMAVATAPKN